MQARAVTGTKLGAQAAEVNATDLREPLLPFAAVAWLVGVFDRQHALLRAVSARRGQVTRAILLGAAALGVLGGTVGIALDPVLITVLESGQDITWQVTPTTDLLGYVVALMVTVLAAHGSARRAAATSPVTCYGSMRSCPASPGADRPSSGGAAG